MKKFHLSLVLALVCCMMAFAACGVRSDVKTLDDARAYYRSMYREFNTTTTGDFEMVSVLRLMGNNGTEFVFNVDYTVEVLTEGAPANLITQQKNDDGSLTKFTFATDRTQDYEYKLTATISDADGKTATYDFGTCKLPQFVISSWEDYVKACEAADGKTVVYVKGYVTAVNADPSSSSKGSVWARDAEGHGYYAYKPELDSAITKTRESINAAFPVGAEVIIGGTVGNSFGYQHNSGCTVTKTGKTAPEGWNTPVDQTEAFSNASGLNDTAALQQYYGSIVTLKNITMGQPDGNNYYFTINGKEYICYKNIYLMDSEASNATVAKWVVGGKANLTGLVTTYSKKFQIYPYSPECLDVIHEDLTDEQIVERAKNALLFNTNHVTKAGKLELTTAVTGYDVEITWALDATYNFATVSEGILNITELPDEATTIKVVATIKKGEKSATKEFSIDVDAKPSADIKSIDLTVDALGLENNNRYADGEATFKGVSFEYVELCNNGNGIQMRTNKNDSTVKSKLWNTTALPKGIVSIKIALNKDKNVFDNTDVWEIKFGSAADSLTETIKLSTVADQRDYTITPSVSTYTFFTFSKIIESYSFYVDSIKLVFEDGGTTPPTPSHVCEHVCPTCGKCTDTACNDPACADKCQGHSTAPVVKNVTYNFATSATKNGKELTATTALDLFKNSSDASNVLTSVAVTKVYEGNGAGGAFENKTGLLKTGTGKLAGKLVLTFEEGKKVAKVEIKCHDFYVKNADHLTNSNTVAVNNGTPVLAPYTEDGTPAVMTFNLDGTSNVVTIDFAKRVCIFEIVITFAE